MYVEDEQETLRGSPSSRSRASSEDKHALLENQHVTYGTTTTDLDFSPTECKAASSPEDGEEAPHIDPEARRRVMYAVPALAIGIFLSSADQTIVVASYGRIGSEMEALNKASWIATAYAEALSPAPIKNVRPH